nr:hypothetical protein Iba_chr11aCG10910 [Ipomoea batatas]
MGMGENAKKFGEDCVVDDFEKGDRFLNGAYFKIFYEEKREGYVSMFLINDQGKFYARNVLLVGLVEFLNARHLRIYFEGKVDEERGFIPLQMMMVFSLELELSLAKDIKHGASWEVRMIVPKGVMFLQQGHALGITEATGHMTRCASSEGESANLGGVFYIMETPAPSKMGSSKQPMDDSSLSECDSHEYGTSCTYEDGGIEVLVRISREGTLVKRAWLGMGEKVEELSCLAYVQTSNDSVRIRRGCTSKDEGAVSLAMVFGAAEANRAKPRLMDDMTAAATWVSVASVAKVVTAWGTIKNEVKESEPGWEFWGRYFDWDP